MKIKKFKNIWTMGLIIFGAILITLYLAKLIVPEFVVKVAEVDSIVKFGTYVNTHKWAYYLFNIVIGYLTGYFYCCACCRKRYLSKRDMCIVLFEVLLSFVLQKYFIANYLTLNIICMLIMPVTICLLDKKKDIKYLYSICTCLTIHLVAQILSLLIRDIALMITSPNIATITILLIDGFIWMLLLYNFYNFKEENKNGNN